MVTARVEDSLVPNAEQILKQYNSVDIADRRSAYEAAGWTGFDPAADVYPDDDLRRGTRARSLVSAAGRRRRPVLLLDAIEPMRLKRLATAEVNPGGSMVAWFLPSTHFNIDAS